MTTIYRDDLGGLERRLQEALGRWEAAREARAGTVRVHARRMVKVLVATWVATALAYALGRVAGAISSTSSRR